MDRDIVTDTQGSRSSLGFYNLHHRSAGVQIGGSTFWRLLGVWEGTVGHLEEPRSIGES